MQIQKSYRATTGQLFLVPTPIGNLEDMSVRCLNTLKQADFIASEDTRMTQKLLNHFEISKKQISFHAHNYKERIPYLLEQLVAGHTIAQVSDAGMPSISDPGHELVQACLAADIPVIALPGPSAGITALIASGLAPQPFTFYGFLPRKKKEQRETLEQMKEATATHIFYESPHRIKATIEQIGAVWGAERQVVICRELTKIHEEYLRGTVTELVAYLSEHPLKGECCLLVSGFTGEPVQDADPLLELPLKDHVQRLIDAGSSPKEAIKQVSQLRQLKKQVVYKAFHVEDDS